MSSIKQLNYGTTPDDMTGDELFYIFKDIDDNFQNFDAMSQGGPCTGSKFTEFRSGIKYAFLTPIVNGALYYISRIQAGAPYSGNQLDYLIVVKKTTTIGGTGSIVAQKHLYVSNSSPKSGLEIFPLVSTDPLSGVNGFVVIDWDQFARGTDYQCNSWVEGALMAINTAGASTGTGGGGGDPGVLASLTENSLVNGASPIYLLNPSSPGMVVTIDSIANIQGAINLKNMSAEDVDVVQTDDLTIDGFASIRLTPLQSVSIVANVDEMVVVTGSYENPL